MALRDDLQRELGVFPLFNFWGPTANLKSTEWIAQATRYMVEQHDPTLTLSYVPHLDYDFQRFGPEDPRSVQSARDLDQVLGRLITDLRRMGRRILVVSEYGIEPVHRPFESIRFCVSWAKWRSALKRDGNIWIRESPRPLPWPIIRWLRSTALVEEILTPWPANWQRWMVLPRSFVGSSRRFGSSPGRRSGFGGRAWRVVHL